MAYFTFDRANKKNYKTRGDYGVRVARPGYDAEICAQNQLIFNSNWPILQIAKVIDLDKKPSYDYMFWDTTNECWVENPDTTGLSIAYTMSLHSASVDKNNLVFTSVAQGFFNSSYQLKYWRFSYKKYHHGLGYVPFFFKSEEVSNIENKIILTSVDISKDVDYPYTEGALPLISKIGDYGISSTSCFNNPRVPGLCSNMFSKLVQCVKTEETSNWLIPAYEGATFGDKILCWSPFNKPSEVVAGEVNKYEAFLFSAYKCPFFERALAGNFFWERGASIDSDPFGGSLYYSRDLWVSMLSMSSDEGSLYDDAVAYSNIAQASEIRDDASLVILRSPMVSPEYEVVVV